MRKFLLKLFLLGSTSLLIAVSLILATEVESVANFLPTRLPLTKGTTSHQWTRQKEADTTRNIQVLIVGPSIGQSIDVREFEKFGLRAFNLSSGSQSPIQTSYLFGKYLDSFNPSLVIWDVYPFTFSYPALESTIDLINNCSDCGEMIPLLIRSNSNLAWATYIKKMMFLPFEEEGFSLPMETPISKYIGAGYMETYYPAPIEPHTSPRFELKPLPLQTSVFEKELRRLKERDIPVILIYSPKSRAYVQNFQNQQEWFDYFNSIVQEGLAQGFINFNHLFLDESINRSHFSDLAHLTTLGVRDYNKSIIDSLSVFLLVKSGPSLTGSIPGQNPRN